MWRDRSVIVHETGLYDVGHFFGGFIKALTLELARDISFRNFPITVLCHPLEIGPDLIHQTSTVLVLQDIVIRPVGTSSNAAI